GGVAAGEGAGLREVGAGHAGVLSGSALPELGVRRNHSQVRAAVTSERTKRSSRPMRELESVVQNHPSRRGGTNPPRPPTAPTMPVTDPTAVGSTSLATRAKTAPEATPREATMMRNTAVPKG